MADPTVFVVAGPARCGKSTLATRVRRELGVAHVMADAVAAGFLESSQTRELLPDVTDSLPVGEWLGLVRSRDRVVSAFVAGYVRNVASVHRESVLVDGPLWPDHWVEIGCVVRAVVLVDTGEAHAERLLSIRDDAGAVANNWQRRRLWSDGRVRRWAAYNVQRGRVFAELGEAQGWPVVDLADFDTLDDAISVAYGHLVAPVVSVL